MSTILDSHIDLRLIAGDLENLNILIKMLGINYIYRIGTRECGLSATKCCKY